MEQVMFGKAMSTFCLVLLVFLTAGPSTARPKPVTTAQQSIKAACAGRDGWSDPAPPAHVFGNTYMVGTCGIVSLLVTSPKGHFLIDGATAEAAPLIIENIRKLGFDPKDVRFLLATHEHLDHVGGLAELQRLTGAKFAVNAAAKTAMETGKPDPTDPQLGSIPPFQGLKVDEVVEDLGDVYFGGAAITLIATPGHTPGGSSWAWQACTDKKRKNCRRIVYADSLSAVSADSYRFTDHPEYVAILRASIDRIGSIKNCDILITPHPAASNFFERLAGEAALVDPKGCATYAASARKRLDDRLAKEAAE
jgi:metallo-beta-lactamase class B